jgi:hypothetical protein
MTVKALTGSVAALALSVSLTGCATGVVQTAYGPMPQYCTQNNAATGAVVGALLGAAIGAAAGGGKGAAIGAGSGAVLGGVTGAQADSQCRQIAAQNAMQMALARQAAMMQQPQMGPVQVSGQQDYVSSDGHRHAVSTTQLNNYTEPATKQLCSASNSTDTDVDGKTSASVPVRMCRGPDGKWNPA